MQAGVRDLRHRDGDAPRVRLLDHATLVRHARLAHCCAPACSGEGNLKVPLDQRRLVLPVERRHRRLGIGRELARLFDVLAVEDILAQRLRQRLAALGQRQIVGRGAAIKRLAEGLHPLRHLEVADAHFAQIVVHIVAKMVEQRLRQALVALRTDFSRRNTSHKCSRSRSKRPLTVSGTPKSRKTTVLAPASRSCHRWLQWCRAGRAGVS